MRLFLKDRIRRKIISPIAEINESIKVSYKKGNRDIEEGKPKYKWITSHSCRRSFCTNEFSAGTPVELIMKIERTQEPERLLPVYQGDT